jgi:hypothetical protein
MSRRLNRAEYNNTVRDLFGVDLHVQDSLPADGGGGEGFDTTGSALFTSTIHIEKYLAAADGVLTNVLSDGTREAFASDKSGTRNESRGEAEALLHEAARCGAPGDRVSSRIARGGVR